MEADLADRGVDLRDLWRATSRLTARRLWALVTNMPATSGLVVTLNEGPVWGLADWLLADVWRAAAQTKKEHPAAKAERDRIDRRRAAKQVAAVKNRRDEFRDFVARREAALAAAHQDTALPPPEEPARELSDPAGHPGS